MSTTIKHTAADKKAGMTLAKLTRFGAACAELDADTHVKAVVGFRGQVQSLEATGEPTGHHQWLPTRIDVVDRKFVPQKWGDE